MQLNIITDTLASIKKLNDNCLDYFPHLRAGKRYLLALLASLFFKLHCKNRSLKSCQIPSINDLNTAVNLQNFELSGCGFTASSGGSLMLHMALTLSPRVLPSKRTPWLHRILKPQSCKLFYNVCFPTFIHVFEPTMQMKPYLCYLMLFFKGKTWLANTSIGNKICFLCCSISLWLSRNTPWILFHLQ